MIKISSLSISETRDMLCVVCDEVIRRKQQLTLLDGPIGDGDHGIGMSRGMTKAKAVLVSTEEDTDVSRLFYRMGRAIIGTMGGSSGVVFGTMFMAAFTETGETTETNHRLTAANFSCMMRNALEKVKQRGKARPGEKTMVDALEPAVLAMEDYVAGGGTDLTDLFHAAAEAAKQGAEATKDMLSRHGHSNTLGQRALGHPDPGAVTVSIIFHAMEDYATSYTKQSRK